MADSNHSGEKREFRCKHCNGKILVPRNLPPTTGPCPHCSKIITSPGPEPAPVSTFPATPAPATATPAQANPATQPPVPPLETRSPNPGEPQKTSIPAPRPEGHLPVGPATHPRESPSPNSPSPLPTTPTPAKPASKPPATTTPDPEPAAQNTVPGKPVEIPHEAKPGSNKRKRPQPSNKLFPVLVVLLILLLGTGAAIYFAFDDIMKLVMPNEKPVTGPKPPETNPVFEENYIRTGWQRDAYQLLADYMAGTTVEEKLPYILNADSLASRMEDFYGGGVINDEDTPAQGFSVYELSEKDRKRGLFMMIYDQPPQFEMKEFFRPLASLEVQYGLDEADILLSSLAKVENFAMEPLRVHAFFKRTDDGLKLDWEVFAQTKYRTLQSFIELPDPGQKEIFRVFIVEDVPDPKNLEVGTRTYRVTDPANTTDTARVNVPVDSEPGRALSIINWRDTENSKPVARTATVELEWTGPPAAPKLRISRFICWEFLGLGGDASTASSR